MTDIEKGKILAYAETLNVEQIALKTGRHPSTIRRFIQKYNATGQTDNMPQTGRPPVLNDHDKSTLVLEATKERRAPLREIRDNVGLTCSLSTAKRALEEAGIHSRVAAKKPFISEKHARARVEWCMAHKDKTVEDWYRVIFSDEASVEIGRQSRQLRVWRRVGERFNADCLSPTFKSGRQSVMVWGCFAGGLKGPLVFSDENGGKKGKMNASRYVGILETNLLPFQRLIRASIGKTAIFQQDNALIHAAKATKEWLKLKEIETMEWPANSPDLKTYGNR
jgi:transposase